MTPPSYDRLTRERLAGKRIALLLSGGVDSAVALHLLAAEGLTPDCFYINIGPEEATQWDCTAEEDLELATSIARRYGCTLETVDCHKEYWQRVVRYTMTKVRYGYTPNPDVMCNRLIKFGAFDDKRGHDYDLIATGHYATTETDAAGRKWLCTSPDPIKDQTDFLAQLLPWQLSKALFPIGHLMKDAVRALAAQAHLINAHRKDSQGICFLGKINYNDYLRRYLGDNPGAIVEVETGATIGTHCGLWYHTIGQRKGLGLSGGPWFVVRKDLPRNILYVSRGYAPADVYRSEFRIGDMNWLTAPINFDAHGRAEITIKIRHTSDYFPALIEREAEETRTYIVRAQTALHGVAPGQFCVVYDTAHHRCYGSAEIVE